MAIKDRNLSVGTKLVARYKKETHRTEVVTKEGKKLRYRLEDGREFKSLSAAGSAVMGGNNCNGWNFWSLEAEPRTTEDTLQADAEESQEDARNRETMSTKEEEEAANGTPVATEESDPPKRSVFRVPNQQGVPQGETRYHCHDCGQSFLTSSEESPQICPKGHPARR